VPKAGFVRVDLRMEQACAFPNVAISFAVQWRYATDCIATNRHDVPMEQYN
jgi:hypothetical protein